MNFDQILSTIGGFGRYQKILYIWICLPQILLAFHMMVSIFTGATPPHRCRDAASAGDSGAILNLSLQDPGTCSSGDGAPLPGNRTARVPCASGWEYSRETFESTTVTEVRACARVCVRVFNLTSLCIQKNAFHCLELKPFNLIPMNHIIHLKYSLVFFPCTVGPCVRQSRTKQFGLLHLHVWPSGGIGGVWSHG